MRLRTRFIATALLWAAACGNLSSGSIAVRVEIDAEASRKASIGASIEDNPRFVLNTLSSIAEAPAEFARVDFSVPNAQQ